MTDKNLGRLEQIRDLKKYWKKEATDFTPWLCEEQNMSLLGDAIGIDLELEEQEKNVGPFRADILCKDTGNNQWVLIENQIEKTDHTHLGQLMTYAAGLHAVTIVWIAARFTDQHRAALDWLNEISKDSLRFFGLEIELWKVDDSLPAPKFNIISKPNDWSKNVIIGPIRLTETKQKQLNYWVQFNNFMKERNGSVKPTKALPQHWMNIGVGRTGFSLSATINTNENKIGVELYLDGEQAKNRFKQLKDNQNQITSMLGDLEWQELPEKIASRIACFKTNENPLEVGKWVSQQIWMAEKLEAFDKCFRPLIKELF